MNSPTRSAIRTAALIFSIGAVVGLSQVMAQTTFVANGIAGSNAGAHTDVAATGPSLYNVTGPTASGITGLTFGNSFTITPTVSGPYDSAFIIGGDFNGDSLSAGTMLAFTYDFTLAKNAFVDGNVNWYLKFSDSVNNPGLGVGGASLVASGTLTGAGANSAVFSGSGTYTFSTGVTTSDTFRAFVEAAYTGTVSGVDKPIVTGTMTQTVYGGGGITISAIPEPSTYAAFAGLGVLGLAVWRRRRAV